MQPIVDGLREQYGAQVDFRYHNALDGGEGQRAFAETGIRGHPGVVVFDAQGRETFRRLGLVDPDELAAAVEAALP
jgi:hypothetical protein